MRKVIGVDELPIEVKGGERFSIKSNNVTVFTHGIHKYPAKFIPHIPRWAIKKFTKSENDIILDPFMGCGTTLVESLLLGRNSFGLEISTLAKKITKVKITPLNTNKLKKEHKKLIAKIKKDKYDSSYWKPNLQNLNKWFKQKAIKKLSIIKKNIEEIEDKDIRDFYLIIMSSIIRRVSNAENQSQKVYVSGRFPKLYVDPIETFIKVANKEKENMILFSKRISKNKNFAKIISKEARNIDLKDNTIDLAITSPPYINAINYINVHKLEYAWLNLEPQEKTLETNISQIGTDKIPASKWKNFLETGFEKLDSLSFKIWKISKKHSYILSSFYLDIKKNLEEIYRVLKDGKRYVIVIGNNKIKGYLIQNNELIKEIAKDVGFEVELDFSYIIKNRLLRIPRNGRGGDINIDHIIVLKK